MLKHVVEMIFFIFIRESCAWNLTCTTDFDRIMACKFSPDHRSTDCSEYSVKVEFFAKRGYECCDLIFVNGQCVCTTDVGSDGFLYGEFPEVILRRNGQIKSNSTIIPKIKPKTPTIISVNQTSTGKPNVTWLTYYKETFFSENLKTELNYKQSKHDIWERVEETGIYKTHYVFNNLELNTEYIVKVRVFDRDYVSEWSKEFTFYSGTSVESVTTTVVPVIILIVIFMVCTLSCCYVKIRKNWIKNKSFSPKIEAIDNLIVTEYKILCPEKTLASKLDVLLPEGHTREEEKRIMAISESGSSGTSGQTESSISTSIDYGLTCHAEKDPVQNQVLERFLIAVQRDLERVREIQSAPTTNPLVLPGLLDYEHVNVQENAENACDSSPAAQSNSGCNSASTFENQCYSLPTTPSPCSSSFFAPLLSCDLGYQYSDNSDQPMSLETDRWNGNLPPLVETELAYRPCDGCLNSESGCPPESENVEANRMFVSLPREQKISKDFLDPCPVPLEQWSPLIIDDQYRSVQSLIPN